jgi:endonuclease G, mitochondrial
MELVRLFGHQINKMKKLLLIFSLLISTLSYAQLDTIRLKHQNYTTVFDKGLKYPVLVEWWVTTAKLSCPNPIPRKDKFGPDPLLPQYTDLAKDYVKSGTDRGHMAPAADNQCLGETAMIECFYFSNMAPQYGALNRGDWKTLEMATRKLAIEQDSIHVWVGNVGVAKRIGRVAVPTHCWKVIYIKKTDTWKAYIFANTTEKADGIENNKVTVAAVEKLTGLKFKK